MDLYPEIRVNVPKKPEKLYKGEFRDNSEQRLRIDSLEASRVNQYQQQRKKSDLEKETKAMRISDSRISVDTGYGSLCEDYGSLILSEPQEQLGMKKSGGSSQFPTFTDPKREIASTVVSSDSYTKSCSGFSNHHLESRKSSPKFLPATPLPDRCQSLKDTSQKISTRKNYSTFSGLINITDDQDEVSDDIFKDFDTFIDNESDVHTLYDTAIVQVESDIELQSLDSNQHNESQSRRGKLFFLPDPAILRRRSWKGWRRRKEKVNPTMFEVIEEENDYSKPTSEDDENPVEVIDKIDKKDMNFTVNTEKEVFSMQEEFEYQPPVLPSKRRRKKLERSEHYKDKMHEDNNEEDKDNLDMEVQLTREQEDSLMYDPYLDPSSYAYRSSRHVQEVIEKEFLDSDVNSINESDDSDSSYESEKVSSVESDKLSIDDSDFNVTDTTYTSVPAISHSESRDLNNLKEMWRQIFEKKEENVHSQSRDLDNLKEMWRQIFPRKQRQVSIDKKEHDLGDHKVIRDENGDMCGEINSSIHLTTEMTNYKSHQIPTDEHKISPTKPASLPQDSIKVLRITRDQRKMDITFATKVDAAEEVFVSKIEPGGSAEAAGFKVGDIILSVNGISCHKRCHESFKTLLKVKFVNIFIQQRFIFSFFRALLTLWRFV